jgi:hypothetical protein
MYVTSYEFSPTSATGKGGKVTFDLLPGAQIRDMKLPGPPAYAESKYADIVPVTAIDQGGERLLLLGAYREAILQALRNYLDNSADFLNGSGFLDLTVEEDARVAAEKAKAEENSRKWREDRAAEKEAKEAAERAVKEAAEARDAAEKSAKAEKAAKAKAAREAKAKAAKEAAAKETEATVAEAPHE